MLPRNSVQVRNTTTKNEKDRQPMSLDTLEDVIELYHSHEEFNNFIKVMELIPEFFTITCSQESLSLLQEVCSVKKTILQYNTAFHLGDYYVSVLSYKHPLFAHNNVVPLVYLIHYQNAKRVHEAFFKWLQRNVNFFENLVIVTDREQAITQSIKAVLPKLPHFLCWNSIVSDVEHWVKKEKNATNADIDTYKTQVWKLLEATSEDQLLTIKLEMQKQWSSRFSKYFEEHLQNDIIASAKYNLQRHDAYSGSGITIKAAESLNAVLKRFLNGEVKVKVLALSLFHLDIYYQKEILRGYCGQENYHLAQEFKRFGKDASEIKWPSVKFNLDDLPYIFQNKP